MNVLLKSGVHVSSIGRPVSFDIHVDPARLYHFKILTSPEIAVYRDARLLLRGTPGVAKDTVGYVGLSSRGGVTIDNFKVVGMASQRWLAAEAASYGPAPE